MANTARLWGAALALVGTAIGAASLPACSSDTGAQPGACGPGEKACEISLTILHTSDIHSRLFPYEQVITQVDSTLGLGPLNTVQNVGGVGRMSYVLQRERARSGRVVHLDSGDCFQGAPIFNFFHGEPEVRSMDALGVDAAVLGNHEFDYGAQNVATQFQRWSNFSLLSANYKYDPMDYNAPSFGRIGTVAKPFTILNAGGLKIAVIGMANLSSLTSIFDAPNRNGVTPLNTRDVVQFYVDMLRPYVDLVGTVSHMGLEVDQRVARNTTGLDFIMGGHNHIVINPPQEIKDCSADPANPGYVWEVNPKVEANPNAAPPDDPEPELKGPQGNFDPEFHPWMFKRACTPRRVFIVHSGAFAKYVGRFDITVSNRPERASPNGDPAAYEPVNGFEILSSKYQAIPITAEVPEDPVVVDMLQPYRRSLDNLVDLDILVGYSPNGSKRIASTGGDSPLGNMVATSIWLRLGVQTDFSLTNSTGIRTDLNPGPVTVEQMYNIFPFDNSITKMQLSGLEVQQLFDFSARRSASRGCASQIQIAGARVRLNCTGCDRLAVKCENDQTCVAAGRDACDLGTKECIWRCQRDEECNLKAPGATCDPVRKVCDITACAEQVYIGNTGGRCTTDAECVGPGEPVNPGQCDKAGARGYCPDNVRRCVADADCADAGGKAEPGSCDLRPERVQGVCMSLIRDTNRYELATSNYLAGGGSGFRVLQRNTTQLDTKVQQRDALLDYMRSGRPCLWKPNAGTPDGLLACSNDADCGSPDAVCACARAVSLNPDNTCSMPQGTDCGGTGRCVLKGCRNDVAAFHLKRCATAPDQASCRAQVGPCQIAGETCKVLTCIDANLGSKTDNRVEMIGR